MASRNRITEAAQLADLMLTVQALGKQVAELRQELRTRDQAFAQALQAARAEREEYANQAAEGRALLRGIIEDMLAGMQGLQAGALNTDTWVAGARSSFEGLKVLIHETAGRVQDLHQGQHDQRVIIMPVIERLQGSCPVAQLVAQAPQLPQGPARPIRISERVAELRRQAPDRPGADPAAPLGRLQFADQAEAPERGRWLPFALPTHLAPSGAQLADQADQGAEAPERAA